MTQVQDRTRRQAFAVLWLGQFVAIAGLTVVVPLLPFYLAELGPRPEAVPWWTGMALAAPAVTQMVSAPLWGMVGDRYGRKAMVVRAQAGLALSVALMGLAETPAQFLACRLLQGACGGVVGATATFASSLTRPERRGRALGGLFGATCAGSLVGPLVGSVLAGRFGFGALFGSVAALLVVSSLGSFVLLREPAAAARADAAPEPLPLRAAAGLLFRPAGCRNLILAGLAGQAAVYALVVVFAPRVGQISGSIRDATVWVGVLQAVTWATSFVGGPWWGSRNDQRVPQQSFALAAVGCALAVALQGIPTDPHMLVPLRAVQGFCFAALAQSVLHVVSQGAPETARGACLGLASSVLAFGQVLGPLLGAVAGHLAPLPGAFVAIALLLGVAALLAARSTRPRGATRSSHAFPGPDAPERAASRAEAGALT